MCVLERARLRATNCAPAGDSCPRLSTRRHTLVDCRFASEIALALPTPQQLGKTQVAALAETLKDLMIKSRLYSA